jgi:hypothetical protein
LRKCACTAEQPTFKVFALDGLPGGTWQMVHLFGSLAPVKSGVGVGVGLLAFATHNAKEKSTQARTARTDEPIRRNNCAPFETISNFFIEAFVNAGRSILSAPRSGQ